MDELKFRLYDKANNKVTKGKCISDIVLEATKMNPNDFSWDCDIPIMKFSGIFSTNDIEIYEGDIIKYLDCETNEYLVDIVEYNRDMTCFLLKKQDENHFPIYLESKTLGLIYDESITFEVIGNIYENKNLLD